MTYAINVTVMGMKQFQHMSKHPSLPILTVNKKKKAYWLRERWEEI